MKSLRTGVLALLALGVTSANAGGLGGRGSIKDAPHTTPFSWTGFYIGAHLGGAWGRQTVTNEEIGSFSNDPNGNVFGGLQGGYNWQYGNIVLGAEAAFGQMLLTQTAGVTQVGGLAASQGDGLYGSLTGRIGYAFGRALVYAKGGFAFFDGEAKVDSPDLVLSRPATNTDTFFAWTIGGGLEYALTPAWSVAAEYQLFDFGERQSVFQIPGSPAAPFDHDLTVHTVKFALNYHFDR